MSLYKFNQKIRCQDDCLGSIKPKCPSQFDGKVTLRHSIITPNQGSSNTTETFDNCIKQNNPNVINFYILSLTPNAGPVKGGNTVIITGNDFLYTKSIIFGTIEITKSSYRKSRILK